MLRSIPPSSRQALRPLFRDYPVLRGCVEAAIEGRVGQAMADSATAPTAGVLHVDFYFLAGDADSPAAAQLVRQFRPGQPAIIVPDSRWIDLLRRTFGKQLQSYRRTSCRPGRWDRSALEHHARQVPTGYRLLRIELEDQVEKLGADLSESLTGNYASPADFLHEGFAFAIEHGGRYIAAISSVARSRRTAEIEIFTHRHHRRLGLATALVARFVLHCLDHDLIPAWDAANPTSAALARKIGFIAEREYEAYYIGREEPV